jgi:hypothetical protein
VAFAFDVSFALDSAPAELEVENLLRLVAAAC